MARCNPCDLPCWVNSILELLGEREGQPDQWEERRQKGLAWVGQFNWREYAAEMTRIYHTVHAA